MSKDTSIAPQRPSKKEQGWDGERAGLRTALHWSMLGGTRGARHRARSHHPTAGEGSGGASGKLAAGRGAIGGYGKLLTAGGEGARREAS